MLHGQKPKAKSCHLNRIGGSIWLWMCCINRTVFPCFTASVFVSLKVVLCSYRDILKAGYRCSSTAALCDISKKKNDLPSIWLLIATLLSCIDVQSWRWSLLQSLMKKKISFELKLMKHRVYFFYFCLMVFPSSSSSLWCLFFFSFPILLHKQTPDHLDN